VVAKKRKRTYI